MKEKLHIPLILGTNRQGRESEKVARWLLRRMKKYDDVETTLIDARDFKLPHDDYGESIKDQFEEFRDLVLQADGFVIVSPEYNHGYPGVLKSVLDLLLKEYFHKAVGIVGVSSGVLGGARMIENLLPVIRELGLTPIFKSLTFIQAPTVFDESGNLKQNIYEKMSDDFFEELFWMARTLKWGRENIPSQFRQLK